MVCAQSMTNGERARQKQETKKIKVKVSFVQRLLFSGYFYSE